MNLIRSVLSASLLVASAALISPTTQADSPQAVPIRLAGGQLETEDARYDYWFQSRFSHVELVTDGFAFAEPDDSLALTDEGDPSPGEEPENRSNQQADDTKIPEFIESPAADLDLELEDSDQVTADQDQTSDAQVQQQP